MTCPGSTVVVTLLLEGIAWYGVIWRSRSAVGLHFCCSIVFVCCIKIIFIKLASLENVFQYKFNNSNYVQYNQDFVAQFFRSKFVSKYACVLFIKMKLVLKIINMN
jgi:hypothetical protein